MLITNLLSLQEKKLVRLEETRRIIRFFSVIIVASFLTGLTLLIPAFLPSFFERQELKRALALEEEASRDLKIKEIITRTRLLEANLSSLKSFAGESSKASQSLDIFLKNVGQGIALSSATLKKGGEVSLSGRASTRRHLLEFEKVLRDSGRFQEISVRLPDILRDTNISFTIQGKLKALYSL